VPPPPPQGRHQRLPPILRITDPIPTTAYSKAPRGLFVLPRVGRIFTASSISPSPSLRQRSSRYAIRAGRNLPDKEFRLMLLLRLGGRWRGHLCRTLHVAMQSGPYLHPMSRVSGVWSLRIPISSVLDFRRFIVSAICAISISPSRVKCRPSTTRFTQRTNWRKSCRFDVRSG
jgi:hypothetical protein